MYNYKLIFLLFLLSSCNETISTVKKSNIEKDSFSLISKGKTDIISILDTFKKYENRDLIYLNFQNNAILDDYCYQGKVNNTNFGIHCKLDPDNYLNLFCKPRNLWKQIDSIPNFGSNYKKIIFKDLNKDKYSDILLYKHDQYRRIVFVYNPIKNTFIHEKSLDILE